jgi:hypothetical protein
MITLTLILSALISLAFIVYNFANSFRSIRDVLQFNIQGSSPMTRLVPNICYTLLFVMLLMLGM